MFRYNSFVVTVAQLVSWCTLTNFCTQARSDWTSFRSGGSSRSDCALPVQWTPEVGIAWQLELPGYGQSTPVILGERVFVTAVEGTRKENCLILCFDLNSGDEQWRYSFPSANPSPSNYMASRAAPTPVVDASAVYAFFETGEVVAVDHQGKLVWQRDLTKDYGKFDNNHGLGCSPAHNDTHIFLNIEHLGPSYLLALDKSSGESVWKVDRESSSSWSSPIVAPVNGDEQVIVSSGGVVSGHSPTDGSQLWSIDGLDGNSVPSPTVSGHHLFVGARLPEFAEQGSVRSNCCIDLAPSDAVTPKILWRADTAVSDYCSPVQIGTLTYFVNKGGILYCLDSSSGDMHYVKRLGTDCWATPIVVSGEAGDDLVYFFGKDGKTLIIKAGPEFEIVASNSLWDGANPPKPEHYVELSEQGSGHGSNASSGSSENASSERRERGGGGRPGGGMLTAMLAGDKNEDGILQADEIGPEFKPMLARVDKNQDGSLDADELKAMADSFAARRSDSQASARDPIVYGAVASDGKLLIRTGTRLYCVQ